jgi:hypothetical protein
MDEFDKDVLLELVEATRNLTGSIEDDSSDIKCAACKNRIMSTVHTMQSNLGRMYAIINDKPDPGLT